MCEIRRGAYNLALGVDWVCISNEKKWGENGADIVDVMLMLSYFFLYRYTRDGNMLEWVELEQNRRNVLSFWVSRSRFLNAEPVRLKYALLLLFCIVLIVSAYVD